VSRRAVLRYGPDLGTTAEGGRMPNQYGGPTEHEAGGVMRQREEEARRRGGEPRPALAPSGPTPRWKKFLWVYAALVLVALVMVALGGA
jgi:hypothetical protein